MSLVFLEGGRFLGEKDRKIADVQSSTQKSPVDREGVLLITGFMAPSAYLRRLRSELRNKDIDAHTVHLPIPRVNLLYNMPDAIEQKAEELAAEHQGQITLVGHSAGGTEGAKIAVKRPDLVKTLIAIESPWGNPAFWRTREKPDGLFVESLFSGRDCIVPTWVATHGWQIDKFKRIKAGHFRAPFTEEVADSISETVEERRKASSLLSPVKDSPKIQRESARIRIAHF